MCKCRVTSRRTNRAEDFSSANYFGGQVGENYFDLSYIEVKLLYEMEKINKSALTTIFRLYCIRC